MRLPISPTLTTLLFMLSPLGLPAAAVETVVVRKGTEGDSHQTLVGETLVGEILVGEILVEAQDGGLMLQADDGRIWTLQPEEILSRKTTPGELVPIGNRPMAKRILEQMPAGFRIHRTKHFLIAYNANPAYSKQVGLLFEQLYRGFVAYWRNQGWNVDEPRFPLVAVVLADQREFLKHSRTEIGELAQSLIGYYHLETNRVTTFNVPNLERNIATLVHEATHLLAYNLGVQRRFADNPMWLSEGLALFFESPDFSNPRTGWRGIGRVNQVNLARWRRYLPSRPADSLVTLLADDSRFETTASAEDSYAESWALTFFLMKTRRKQFVAYLRELSDGEPLQERTPRERIAMFERVFEDSVATIDQELLKFIARQ